MLWNTFIWKKHGKYKKSRKRETFNRICICLSALYRLYQSDDLEHKTFHHLIYYVSPKSCPSKASTRKRYIFQRRIRIKIKKEGGKEERRSYRIPKAMWGPTTRHAPRRTVPYPTPFVISDADPTNPPCNLQTTPPPARTLHRRPSSTSLARLRRTTADAAGRHLCFSRARVTLLTTSIFSGRRWCSPSPVCDCRRPPPSPSPPAAESPGPDSALIPAGLVSPPSSPRRIRSLVSSCSALFLSLWRCELIGVCCWLNCLQFFYFALLVL